MTEKFGKPIHIFRLEKNSVKNVESLWRFSLIHKEKSFKLDDVFDFMLKDIKLKRDVKTKAMIRALLSSFHKKGAVGKLTEQAYRGKPQVYYFKSNDWTYGRFKTTIGQKRKLVGGKKVTKDAPIQKKDDAGSRLTLEHARQFDDMDLAFIGYSIRTEMDILQKQNDMLTDNMAKLETDFKELEKRSADKSVYMIKIQDLEEKIKKLKVDHSKELSEKDNQITRLNDRLTTANEEIKRFEKSEYYKNANKKGFSVGELAFPNGRPKHLQKEKV